MRATCHAIRSENLQVFPQASGPLVPAGTPDGTRPGRRPAVPAASRPRAARYAALGVASALAPGPPDASGAGAAGASW